MVLSHQYSISLSNEYSPIMICTIQVLSYPTTDHVLSVSREMSTSNVPPFLLPWLLSTLFMGDTSQVKNPIIYGHTTMWFRAPDQLLEGSHRHPRLTLSDNRLS